MDLQREFLIFNLKCEFVVFVIIQFNKTFAEGIKFWSVITTQALRSYALIPQSNVPTPVGKMQRI